ncbi:Diphosphomevalonate decarboxylase [Astathelohania contejeani]|uniref:Diphosphomevalonate decarboxylase n=1 Tax=Astathelohania contejeani TaxID=164912 RepID=A0ABQ7HYT9_9MICR|nr:Diphosphomevalonate decarboxylase [Thelohania contejeani]
MSKSQAMGYGLSHPNIALVKYWGKKDIERNIPTNMSVSLTLEKLCTDTRIYFQDEGIDHHTLKLNDKEHPINERMLMVIKYFQEKVGCIHPLKIVSMNNFPSDCGLASSASGFSALVLALDDFYHLGMSKQELSEVARLGSGSASRSIFSGFVYFENEGSTHFANWNEIRVFSLITEPSKKKVGSTEGMIRTVQTSNLFKWRLKEISHKAEKAIKYIKEKNFEELALLTMKESNEMHAVMMDTFPPICYLNKDSFKIIEECHFLNTERIRVAYTFDAGPNPFIITQEKDLNEMIEHFTKKFEYKIIIAN